MMVRLGDLFDFKNGRSFKQTEWKDVGLPIIRIQNLNKVGAGFNFFDGEYDSAIEVNKNDLLFSWSGTVGSSFGPHIWQRDTGVLNQHIFKISFKTDMLLKYAFYSLLFITEAIERSVVGAVGLVHVTKKSLNEFKIPEPPISEQKRIVAILDQAFADIEQARAKTEQNLKNARELFESYLQQVFSQRGEGWVETTLENLVTDDCSLSYGIVQPGDDVNGGMAVVRPTDMKKELINLDGLKLIDPVKAEGYQRTKLKGGELLVCVRGSTGITSIACNSLAGSNVTRGIVPVRFDPLKISDRFGYYQFISPLVQTQIKSATYGAALMQINIRDFRKIILSVPTLEKQTEIANKLDEIAPELKKVEKIYDSKISALDELKRSILQKAFSGELTKTSDSETSKGAAA
ncbi:MAG: restriction endonuclease subunit S [Oleispira sp.]|nr:restriction endonuclease subunit S [Oleispira sp.]